MNLPHRIMVITSDFGSGNPRSTRGGTTKNAAME